MRMTRVSHWHSGGIAGNTGDCQSAIEIWNLSLQYLFLPPLPRPYVSKKSQTHLCVHSSNHLPLYFKSNRSSNPNAIDLGFSGNIILLTYLNIIHPQIHFRTV
jgi:hypothetical protein